MDDPTSSLDNTVSESIMESIKNDDFWNKRTFVMSTNNLGLLKYADRVIFMENGKIVAIDTPEKIIKLKEYSDIALEEEEHENVKILYD